MGARQNLGFASDLANLIEGAGIGTALAGQHVIAEDEFAQTLESAGGELLLLGVLGGDRGVDFGLNRVDSGIAIGLGVFRGIDRVAQFFAVGLQHILVQIFVERWRLGCNFLRLHFVVELLDGRDDLANFAVGEFEGLGILIFGNFEGAGFDHDDRLVGAGHDQVHLAELLIGDRWVHDELAVEQTDAHAGDRVHERNLGDV